MIEEIRKRIIESDLTPHDLRIVLDILKEFEEKIIKGITENL